MKGKRVNLPYRPYSQSKPSQVIFRSLSVSRIPGGSRKSHSRDADFVHVDHPRDFETHFRFSRNIYEKRVVALAAEKLGTMSKNKLSGIALGITPIKGIGII